MNEPKLKRSSSNPLAELSELRLECSQQDEKLELLCRLIFGTMVHMQNGVQFEVGVRHAFLRLSLEGCETTLDRRFGEHLLPSVVEEVSMEKSRKLGLSAELSVPSDLSPGVSAAIQGLAEGTSSKKLVRNVVHLPVQVRPNDSWEIQPVQFSNPADAMIIGTAIAGDQLCLVQRLDGGNRVLIIAEVQVAKRNIVVKARSGNKVGRAISEYRNKDVIVGQLIKRAIQREASLRTSVSDEFVSISRCEIQEE